MQCFIHGLCLLQFLFYTNFRGHEKAVNRSYCFIVVWMGGITFCLIFESGVLPVAMKAF